MSTAWNPTGTAASTSSPWCRTAWSIGTAESGVDLVLVAGGGATVEDHPEDAFDPACLFHSLPALEDFRDVLDLWDAHPGVMSIGCFDWTTQTATLGPFFEVVAG